MNKNFSHFPVVVLLACFILINKASGTDEARFFGRLPFLNANDNNYCDTACGKQQTRFAFFSILRNFCISRCPNSVVAHLGNSNSGSSPTNPNGSQSNINNIMHQVMQQMANNPSPGGIPNFSIAPFPGNGNGQPQITFGNQPGNGIGQIVPNLQGPANGPTNTLSPGAPTQTGTSPAAGAPTAPAGTPGAATPAGTPGAAAPAGAPGAAPPAGAPGAAPPAGAPGAAPPAGAPGAAPPAGR